MTILGVDIGTTALKMGVFQLSADGALVQIRGFTTSYPINIYNEGTFGDIEQVKWQEAFRRGCRELAKSTIRQVST